MAADVEVATRVVSHLKARPGPGLVATNPPYGRRVGRDGLRGLYGRLGSVVRDRLPGHDLAVLTTDPRLARAADGKLRPRLRFRTGGLAVQLHYRPAEPRPADRSDRDEVVESPTADRGSG